MIKFADGDNGSNWDLYDDGTTTIQYIATRNGAADGCFGNLAHIRKLIRNGYFPYTLTEHGRTMMATHS